MVESPGTDLISTELGVRPGKVIAVHLNYRSRAAQRGRTPAHGSYFLKPSSSLAASDGVIERPSGTELLVFEGEIALVIDTPAYRVEPELAWSHVGWVTAANDFGLYDLRYADRGSNLRAKGGDGFTPIGPTLLDARTVDPMALRLHTWVDGELAQSDDTENLLFPFAELVADLSRLSTLERGDVILTGTPAGASVVHPGSVVEVQVDSLAPGRPVSTGRLRTTIVEGPKLATVGAPAKVDAALRADALGTVVAPVGRPVSPVPAEVRPAAGVLASAVPDELLARLGSVAVATLSAQLRRRGLNDVSVDGVHPARPGSRFTGRARTLRYLPHRPDLFDERGGGFNAQKRAIESVGPGEVLVMDARGERGTGTIGDILALRAQVRGAAAIVTDGGLRDAAAVAELDIPVFHAGAHPAVLGRRHVPWEIDVAIACGGTTVLPGDILAGDDDGVVVIPPAIAEEVLTDAVEQERQERFVTEQVAAGASVDGLYPLSGSWLARYRDWLGTQ
ncbi:MAG: 5-oxopent-3-ene,2,5-tricarboxylate decarboxylase / 2-hydroxyhepta-2,4-diene,7-dioate isomerase [Pseudonocardiales bacterium]|nr:5-oxopent-3-ene,2,5-tricarboxylate decarboxylase / 2-hydroxyhepta-2,4-diene,7-dioate isomerase [Pseudonocardiales bacterium]